MQKLQKLAKQVDKLWSTRLRWYGHVNRREEGYTGKRMIDMAILDKRKRRLKRRWMDLVISRRHEDGWSKGEK